MPRPPVYFISHGGPTTCYDSDHPVHNQLSLLGQEILSLNARALVVFGAHWQASPTANPRNTTSVQVSSPPNPLPLIYDFYGFPAHYYRAKYEHRTDPGWGERVVQVLKAAGVNADREDRGLDHGVWVPFKVMFEGREAEVPPIVQVSLLDSEDADAHLRLGRAVESLRDQGVVLLGSGMAVHNLYGLGGMVKDSTPEGFTLSFDDALRRAVESEPGEERDGEMSKLVEREDARKAHPTFEHLLPIHVAVGAAGMDRGKRLWTMPEASLSWAQFKFGDV